MQWRTGCVGTNAHKTGGAAYAHPFVDGTAFLRLASVKNNIAIQAACIVVPKICSGSKDNITTCLGSGIIAVAGSQV